MDIRIWIPIGVAVLGVVPLLLVWLKLTLNKKFIEKAETTTGTVENLEERRGAKGSRYFVATINYTTYMRENIRGTHILFYHKKNKLVPGQQLVVLYNPLKPHKFRLKDYPFNFKSAWIITGILAVGYLVLAFFLWKEMANSHL